MESRKDFFDRQAASWGDGRTGGEPEALSEIVGSFGLSEGDVVLDVGTGTGVLLPWIQSRIGRKGKLIAMDFSFRMLVKAKERLLGEERVSLIHGSVESIPFRTDQFDHVTCFSAFPHFPNKARALFEMVRVLKTSGRLSMAHLKSAEEINEMHRQMGGAVGHDVLPHPERIRMLMKDSGLCEVSILNEPGRFLAQGRKV